VSRSAGWFQTGDLVRSDDDGLYYVLGRRGAMMPTGRDDQDRGRERHPSGGGMGDHPDDRCARLMDVFDA
jgi:hypothetical protein